MKTGNKEYEVAAYYFPNYHVDPMNEKQYGKGWTEWRLMQCARPRFDGHLQPKVPLWGYEDESDPEVMRKKIAAAAEHGITAFIFDWYWYEEGKFLSAALEKGFFEANKDSDFKFSLMWANHDWSDIFPAKVFKDKEVLYKGGISEEKGYAALDYIVDKYFSRKDYWVVDGGFYFSVYDLACFIRTFGGVEKTKKALEYFRKKASKYGKIHLNCIYYEVPLLKNEVSYENFDEITLKLGFDSVTSYTWLHHHATDKLFMDYGELTDLSVADNDLFSKRLSLPYFPNVSVGWDSSPRTVQSDTYDNYEAYPFSSVMKGNTPEAFRKALLKTREKLDGSGLKTKIVTINAWNEWSEGSYLEPDTANRYEYLEAVKDVFKNRRGSL